MVIFFFKSTYNDPLHERIRRNKFSVKRHPEHRGVTWFDYLHVLFQEPYSHLSFKLVICAQECGYPQVTAHQCILNHTWSPRLTCVGGYVNKAEPIFSRSCLCFLKAVEACSPSSASWTHAMVSSFLSPLSSPPANSAALLLHFPSICS